MGFGTINTSIGFLIGIALIVVYMTATYKPETVVAETQ